MFMASEYQKQYMQFLSEVKDIEEARNAIYNLSDEAPNLVYLSGSVVGKDTNDKINKIGTKYGLLVLTDELNVLFMESEIEQINKNK